MYNENNILKKKMVIMRFVSRLRRRKDAVRGLGPFLRSQRAVMSGLESCYHRDDNTKAAATATKVH